MFKGLPKNYLSNRKIEIIKKLLNKMNMVFLLHF